MELCVICRVFFSRKVAKSQSRKVAKSRSREVAKSQSREDGMAQRLRYRCLTWQYTLKVVLYFLVAMHAKLIWQEKRLLTLNNGH